MSTLKDEIKQLIREVILDSFSPKIEKRPYKHFGKVINPETDKRLKKNKKRKYTKREV